MGAGVKFLEQLYAEQRMHKEHRFKYVIYKLSFVAMLFGVGSLELENNILRTLIYLVPIVALCYDVYIFAEDYKVKRIGIFLLDIKEDPKIDEKTKDVISNLEVTWQKWLKKYREQGAYKASFIITVTASIGSALILSTDVLKAFSWHRLFLSVFWFVSVVIFTILVFYYGRSLRKRATTMVEELKGVR